MTLLLEAKEKGEVMKKKETAPKARNEFHRNVEEFPMEPSQHLRVRRFDQRIPTRQEKGTADPKDPHLPDP